MARRSPPGGYYVITYSSKMNSLLAREKLTAVGVHLRFKTWMVLEYPDNIWMGRNETDASFTSLIAKDSLESPIS